MQKPGCSLAFASSLWISPEITSVLAVILLTLNLLRPLGTMLPMRTPFMALVAMYGAFPNSLVLQILPPMLYSVGIGVERSFWLTDNTAGDFPSDLLILFSSMPSGCSW